MRLFLAAIVFLASVSTFAEDHYIRAGSNGNGSDWANALPSLPTTLQRGDTYYIADGTYSSYTFDDPVSGSTYITIKKATPASHGTDVGWTDSYGAGSAKFGGLNFNSNYYIVDGGKRDSMTSGYGISVTMSGDVGVQIGGRQYITLRHIEITAPNITMHATGISGTTGSPANITLQNVYIHDIFGCPIYIIGASNILIEGSVIARNKSTSDWHSEGIQARATNGMIVRYNQFIAIQGTAVIVSGSGNSGNWQIYGNIFDNQGRGVGNGIIADNFLDSISNVYIYNNVFANFKGGNGAIAFYASGSNRIVQNNLWYGTDWVPFSGVTRDYNYFASCRFPFAFTPAAHENAAAQDSSGKYSADQSNPFVNSAAGDFHLKAPLPLNGNPLASPYDKDPDGRTRGADGVFDIGVYEYGGGAQKPGPVDPPSPVPSPRPSPIPSVQPSPVPSPIPSPRPSPLASPSQPGMPSQVPSPIPSISSSTLSVTFSPALSGTVSGALHLTVTPKSGLRVSRMRLYVDGAYKSREATPPYTFTVDTTKLRNGAHTIKIVVVNSRGIKVGEISIPIIVSN